MVLLFLGVLLKKSKEKEWNQNLLHAYHSLFNTKTKLILDSVGRKFRHWSSQTVEAMAGYSASDKECATADCFFHFHETRETLKNMQKPATDLLVVLQVLNAFNCNEEEEG